jgi:hypothetical protein
MITYGQFDEYQLQQNNYSRKFGSGYPSDPTCKEWLNRYIVDPIFTYPNNVRFSWAPIKKLIQQQEEDSNHNDHKTVIPIVFAADDINNDEDNNDVHKIKIGIKRQQEQMNVFLGKKKPIVDAPKKKLPYFERRNIQPVLKL